MLTGAIDQKEQQQWEGGGVEGTGLPGRSRLAGSEKQEEAE